MVVAFALRGSDPAVLAVYRGPNSRARRFLQALQGRDADLYPRAALSAGAGLRFRDHRVRRGDGWDRPEVQPAGGARDSERFWAVAADRADYAFARRARRREQDVEVARELYRHHRAG